MQSDTSTERALLTSMGKTLQQRKIQGPSPLVGVRMEFLGEKQARVARVEPGREVTGRRGQEGC